MSEDNVGQYEIRKLFEQNLIIPEYQRPYTWDNEQVQQLLSDLLEAMKNYKTYLIGNMILYENNKSQLEIVDGQQRVTTLALVLKVLGEDKSFLTDNQVSILSEKRLKENFNILQNFFQNFSKQEKEEFKNFLYEKVIITYIKASSLDEAFVLFDSQNTRGKPLKRKDILKVHHIHPIKENRKVYAKRWETWEKNKVSEKIDRDRLDEMLYFLSFIRKGIRNELYIDDLDNIDVFKELKTKTSHYHLNNYNQPPIYESFEFDFEKNLLSLTTKPIKFSDRYIVDGVKYLPFEIHSSIDGGEKFFMYIWKYYELYQELLKNRFFTYLDRAYGSGNNYLKKIYQTALFFYFDKFGNDKFEEFAIRIFILLLYLRVIKSSIRKEKVLSYEWNDLTKLDFYKVILLSYAPEEVIDTIDEYIKFHISYEIDHDDIQFLDKNRKPIEIKNTKKVFFNLFDKKIIVNTLKDRK